MAKANDGAIHLIPNHHSTIEGKVLQPLRNDMRDLESIAIYSLTERAILNRQASQQARCSPTLSLNLDKSLETRLLTIHTT